MKQDIMCLLTSNIGLLPGQLALATYGMSDQGNLNLINFLCWVGVFLTINFIIACAFSAHISEQKQIEAQQERIENAE